MCRRSQKGGWYKPPEDLSPCLFFAILVTDRVCEYPTKRLNPFLDVSDLLPVGGGLLQEAISSQ